MPLTLRPTGLRVGAAFPHLRDWSVYEDGQDIGRLREEHAPSRPELAWYWSITVMAPPAIACAPTATRRRSSRQRPISGRNGRRLRARPVMSVENSRNMRQSHPESERFRRGRTEASGAEAQCELRYR
jgi:hypothetical protein